jgi:hypothetical protein
LAGTAGGATAALTVLTGLRLEAWAAVLRGALVEVFELGAALVAGLTATLAVALALYEGLAELVLEPEGVDVAFMESQLSKLTVYTVYTVDFSSARHRTPKF